MREICERGCHATSRSSPRKRTQRHYRKMTADERMKRNEKGSEDLGKSAETEEVSHMYDKAI